MLVSNTAAAIGQQRPCRGRKRGEGEEKITSLHSEGSRERPHAMPTHKRQVLVLPAEGWRWGWMVWQVPQHTPYKVLLQFTTRSIKCCILSESHERGDAGCYQQGIVHGGRKKHICHQEWAPMLSATAQVADCHLSCNGKDSHAQNLPGPSSCPDTVFSQELSLKSLLSVTLFTPFGLESFILDQPTSLTSYFQSTIKFKQFKAVTDHACHLSKVQN